MALEDRVVKRLPMPQVLVLADALDQPCPTDDWPAELKALRCPAELEDLHHPALVVAFYRRMQEMLAQPISILNEGQRRFIVILDTVVLECCPDGQIHAHYWNLSADCCFWPEPIPDDRVCLDELPTTTLWIEPFARLVELLLLERWPLLDIDIKGYTIWLEESLLRLLWTDQERKRIAALAAAELPVKTAVLARAASAQPRLSRPFQTRLDAYNHVLRHWTRYQSVDREAPNLAPLLDVFAGELSARGDVKQDLRSLLVSRGLQPSFWRAMANGRSADGDVSLGDWLTSLADYYGERPSYPEVALDLLLIAQAASPSALPHLQVMRDLFSVAMGELHWRIDQDAFTCMMPILPLAKRLEQLLMKDDAHEVLATGNNIQDVLRWGTHHAGSLTPQFLKHASAGQLLNLANGATSSSLRRGASAEPWTVPFRVHLTEPEVEAVVLRSDRDMAIEASLARNCLGQLVDRGRSGESVFVSIRKSRVSDGAPVHQRRLRSCAPLATCEIEVGSVVRLTEVKGFANRDVDRNIRRLARECANQIRRQVWEWRLASQAVRGPQLSLLSSDPSQGAK